MASTAVQCHTLYSSHFACTACSRTQMHVYASHATSHATFAHGTLAVQDPRGNCAARAQTKQTTTHTTHTHTHSLAAPCTILDFFYPIYKETRVGKQSCVCRVCKYKYIQQYTPEYVVCTSSVRGAGGVWSDMRKPTIALAVRMHRALADGGVGRVCCVRFKMCVYGLLSRTQIFATAGRACPRPRPPARAAHTLTHAATRAPTHSATPPEDRPFCNQKERVIKSGKVVIS